MYAFSFWGFKSVCVRVCVYKYIKASIGVMAETSNVVIEKWHCENSHPVTGGWDVV